MPHIPILRPEQVAVIASAQWFGDPPAERMTPVRQLCISHEAPRDELALAVNRLAQVQPLIQPLREHLAEAGAEVWWLATCNRPEHLVEYVTKETP